MLLLHYSCRAFCIKMSTFVGSIAVLYFELIHCIYIAKCHSTVNCDQVGYAYRNVDKEIEICLNAI